MSGTAEDLRAALDLADTACDDQPWRLTEPKGRRATSNTFVVAAEDLLALRSVVEAVQREVSRRLLTRAGRRKRWSVGGGVKNLGTDNLPGYTIGTLARHPAAQVPPRKSRAMSTSLGDDSRAARVAIKPVLDGRTDSTRGWVDDQQARPGTVAWERDRRPYGGGELVLTLSEVY